MTPHRTHAKKAVAYLLMVKRPTKNLDKASDTFINSAYTLLDFDEIGNLESFSFTTVFLACDNKYI